MTPRNTSMSKRKKVPVLCISGITKKYKRNTVLSDSRKSPKIVLNFDTEIKIIATEYSKAGYPLRFIKSVIPDFTIYFNKEGSVLIQLNLFEVKKPFLSLEIPYCELNETALKRFIKNFHQFTDEKYDIGIK